MASPPSTPDVLSWSAVLDVSWRPDKMLTGDKILLPQSALEQLLAASTTTRTVSAPSQARFDPFNPYAVAAARAQRAHWQDTTQQLPHPLTFRLVNPQNGNVVYGGVREFSAEEGQVALSPFLTQALGLAHLDRVQDVAGQEDIGSTRKTGGLNIKITIHAKQLPRGDYVRLRPIEAGYNPADWKALLEKHLRENFTTLTMGETLSVRTNGGTDDFRFLVDKILPEGEGICVVDTDLAVDIEALDEEQARETVRRAMAESRHQPTGTDESSPGGDLDLWRPVQAQITGGDYIDYQLPSWDRSQTISFELTSDHESLALFASPFSNRQRAKPREDEHIWGVYTSSPKVISIEPTNIELEGAESLLVSVYAPPELSNRRCTFSLRSRLGTIVPTDEPVAMNADVDMVVCPNCLQSVPTRSLMLHENFCLRNNILCPECKGVYQKRSTEWKEHWHCPHDTAHGDSPTSLHRHNDIFHTPRQCPNCAFEAPNLPAMAAHRTSVCPGKLILCQFCHLEVPQEGDASNPSVDALISGLTAHELVDGGRTTDCHLCGKLVRLRDMTTHLKHHELERNSRRRPDICRNVECGRTLDGVGLNGQLGTSKGAGHDIGLCRVCFGPLYVSMHDPEGKALKRRIERRYLSQLLTGCGKSWCRNPYCRMTRVDLPNLTTREALPLVKPLLANIDDPRGPMHFCVDESSCQARLLATMLAAEGNYSLEWCIAACEAAAGKLDLARTWLADWAPREASVSE